MYTYIHVWILNYKKLVSWLYSDRKEVETQVTLQVPDDLCSLHSPYACCGPTRAFPGASSSRTTGSPPGMRQTASVKTTGVSCGQWSFEWSCSIHPVFITRERLNVVGNYEGIHTNIQKNGLKKSSSLSRRYSQLHEMALGNSQL